MIYQITKPTKVLKGEISLDGSKSISNRVLLIRALSKATFEIVHLSSSKDTKILQELLNNQREIYDTGAAGTTFRFLTAYLSFQKNTQILTGSERMKQRPIGTLVNELRQLGAKIEYLARDGFPPLRISEAEGSNNAEINIDAGTSSQFISALLMIGPCLPNGLTLHLEGRIVSRPYIEMTLKTMRYFNVKSDWVGQTIKIKKQDYKAKDIKIESDWSGASYYYAMAAFCNEVDLQLNGLFEESIQGDFVIAEMMRFFGVITEFNATGIRLTKLKSRINTMFRNNFIQYPDLAQTLAVVCAGTKTEATFTGLSTLKIKETDRVKALMVELAKIGVNMLPINPGLKPEIEQIYSISGMTEFNLIPRFGTYNDHRMALAFATLAIIGKIEIEDPDVVIKSYGNYWKDMEKLGFQIRAFKF